MLTERDLVVWDVELSMEDKDDVGSQIATLCQLSRHGVSTLPQIVITKQAFSVFLKDNHLDTQLKHLLGSLNHERHDSLSQISKYSQKLITEANIHRDIYQPLFKKEEKLSSNTLTLSAFYFRDKKIIGSLRWEKIHGESMLIDQVRSAWAHLYSVENLKLNALDHSNSLIFSCVLLVSPEYEKKLSGHIKTFGKGRNEYEIEAYSMVKFTYNKITSLVEKGHVPNGGDKNALSAIDVKKLLSYAHAAEKALYFPQKIKWMKYRNEFLVHDVISQHEQDYNDSQDTLIKNFTVHPGITIGRLRVVNEKEKEDVIINDEIVILKSLDRNMIETLRKARGIILENDPHPEVTAMLKSLGIPAIIHKNKNFLYSTGDVVSLNATTGEIRRGSLLVS